MSIVDLFQFPGDKVELIDCGGTKGTPHFDFMLFKQTVSDGFEYYHVMIDSGRIQSVSLREWTEAQDKGELPPGVQS